jgi:membrane-bound lytic murein transglycosylase A
LGNTRLGGYNRLRSGALTEIEEDMTAPTRKWTATAALAPAAIRVTLLFAAVLFASEGCARPAPDYLRPLPRGKPALRRVADPAKLPDLKAAFERRDPGLIGAIDRSLAWFDAASAKPPQPVQLLGITYERARLSTLAFREVLRTSTSPDAFQRRISEEFDVYASVGWDGAGAVLFTGYYAPIYSASKVRTGEYRYPLYGRPPDLLVEEGTERVLGRDVGGRIVPYPARAEIEQHPDRLGLVGREIAWLNDRLDAFLVHVQGSARLELVDGGAPLHVEYAGSNGHEYTSIGRLLAADGKMERSRINLPAIRAFFRDHPEELDSYLRRNDRYIFFREAGAERWPIGSLGFEITPMRSLATDKTMYPGGCVVLVQTELATPEGGWEPLEQFMVDQDAGGGIRAPGRADIYVGVGDVAGEIAGRQAHAGRLYYFFLKRERLAAWAQKAKIPR